MVEQNETTELLRQISAKLDTLNGTIRRVDEENEKRERLIKKDESFKSKTQKSKFTQRNAMLCFRQDFP